MSTKHIDSACLSFIRKIAGYLKWRFELPEELDELVSHGFIGYCEAMERFNPAAGVKPTTFAYHRIRGAIMDASNKRGGLNRWMHKRALIGNANYIPNNTQTARIETEVLLSEVDKYINGLPSQQRDIIRYRHFNELSFAEIGEIYGHKRSWACKTHKKALLRLQLLLGECNWKKNAA